MTLLPIDRPVPVAIRADKLRGVHLAVVVWNGDDPPENPGYRVLVKYPWLNDPPDAGKATVERSFWARIAVPMAGPGRGTYFLPDGKPKKEDQLLVVFEHGYIEKPIVIGALWNSKQPPVEVNGSQYNNTKLIKSRAGHRIIFDDKEGAEKVTIVDCSKKNKIVFDSVKKIVTIECCGDIIVKAKKNVIMHANALKVGTTEKVTVKAQQVLTHAESTFNLKASTKIDITGSQVTVNVTHSPACKVSGQGEGELGAKFEDKPEEQIKELPRSGGVGEG